MLTTRTARQLVGVLLIATAFAATGEAAAMTDGGLTAQSELLEYRWRLQGFAGLLARLFIPTRGDGTLSLSVDPEGLLRSELKVTSTAAEREDYWLYGALIDPGSRRTLEAWNSYRYRRKSRERRARLEDPEVVDIPSAIYLMRTDGLEETRNLKIWTDGKIYPIAMIPLGISEKKVRGERLMLRHVAIRPIKVKGERPWKGKLDMWFAADPESTPVEIYFQHPKGRVRMTLAEPIP